MKTNNNEFQDVLKSAESIGAFFAQVANSGSIGLDTEFMRVKTYFPQLCLMQVSAQNGDLACIDPLEVDAAELAKSLQSINGTFVIHSSGQDLEVLQLAFGFVPPRLFDTQIATALLGLGDQMGYAGLVEYAHGVRLPKGETRTDWCRRPLTPAQIEYARADVLYLCGLHGMLGEKLEKAGKTDWAEQEFRRLLESRDKDDEQGVIARTKGGADLPVAKQWLLRKLVLWRETMARTLNRPREWIVSSSDLVNIARRRPMDQSTLAHCTQLNPTQVRKYMADILGMVTDGDDGDGSPVWQASEPFNAEQRKMLKRLQQHVRDRSRELSVSPSILANRSDLEGLMRNRPNRCDNGWREEVIGKSLLELLD